MKATRRDILSSGSLFLLAPGATKLSFLNDVGSFTIGIITDAHYADCDATGTRCYRESKLKMRQAVETIRERKPAFCVCLGDLIDGPAMSSREVEASNLKEILTEISKVGVPVKYVFGNHCVAQLSKKQFLDSVNQKSGSYSFDSGEHHFIVLDACYRQDGVSYDAGNFVWTDTFIPEPQQQWLAEDLAKTKLKTYVFCHQRLDLPDKDDAAVKNASAIRTILESSGKVQCVFMGHSHVNTLNRINDIPYVCLHSMVDGTGLENNAFSVVTLFKDGSLKLEGFGKHAKHPLAEVKSLR